MFDRFERPLKIICLALAALLAWQLGRLILRGDPLANLKIPALPALPESTNEPAKLARKETNAAPAKKTGDHGTNANTGATAANSTNVVTGTNLTAKSTNAPAAGDKGPTNASSGPTNGGLQKSGPSEGRRGPPPGISPEAMARMMGGGMPGGPGGGMKKIELPPEAQARVDKIIDSEILGPVIRPMPLALIGIADQEAFIRAVTGQTGPVKVGGELGGIKLLRIGINRVLVEQDGEKKELTLFGGLGGESLLPKETNAPSTNAPPSGASTGKPPASHDSTNQIRSSKKRRPSNATNKSPAPEI